MTAEDVLRGVDVVGLADGPVTGVPGVNEDRFLVDGGQSAGRLAIVEHRVAPGVLAAPVHRHSREDEWSFVLEGTVELVADGHLVRADAGTLVAKPAGQWHTFWNPGPAPLRILELIAPAGLEQLFRRLDDVEDPGELAELARAFGCDVDLDASQRLAAERGLTF